MHDAVNQTVPLGNLPESLETFRNNTPLRTVEAVRHAAFSLPIVAQTRANSAPNAVHSKWYTLGTVGGPLASATRSQPANLFIYGDELVLVDCGDGTAEQLAKISIPVGKVTAVVINHLHFDHTGGLFALLGMRFQAVPPPVLTVYGPPGTNRTIDGLIAAMQPEAEGGAGIPGASKAIQKTLSSHRS